MSVEVKGLKQLEKELEQRFGREKMQQVSDKALKDGAKVFVKELKAQVRTFSDGVGHSTGGTYEEITISDPVTVGGSRTVKVHWRGPKGSYRIIHLNEWGTVNNPNPAGKGAIATALRNAESAYRKAIKQAIERGI